MNMMFWLRWRPKAFDDSIAITDVKGRRRIGTDEKNSFKYEKNSFKYEKITLHCKK